MSDIKENPIKMLPVDMLVNEIPMANEPTQLSTNEDIFKVKKTAKIPLPTNNDKIRIEEEVKIVEKVHEPKPEPKPKKKKRVLTDKQKEALRKGREKSLKIRQAKKLEKEKEKEARYERRMKAMVDKKVNETILERNERNLKVKKKEDQNPFTNINLFFSMMDKYEQYKQNKRINTKVQTRNTVVNHTPTKKVPKKLPKIITEPKEPLLTGYEHYFE